MIMALNRYGRATNNAFLQACAGWICGSEGGPNFLFLDFLSMLGRCFHRIELLLVCPCESTTIARLRPVEVRELDLKLDHQAVVCQASVVIGQ